jgi:hypothetical protein
LRDWEILVLWSHIDGVVISLPTFWRNLSSLWLYIRQKKQFDFLEIALFLLDPTWEASWIQTNAS